MRKVWPLLNLQLKFEEIISNVPGVSFGKGRFYTTDADLVGHKIKNLKIRRSLNIGL